MTNNTYTGTFRKLPDGTFAWTVQDRFGWVFGGTAVAARDEHGAFYRMTGELGPTPEHCRLPDEDAMRNPIA